MIRTAYAHLEQWKARETRRPLILRGPRQVGKTWLMQTFGREHYQHVIYIDFENDPRMEALFTESSAAEPLVMGLELYAGHKIDPDNTLLIFDEIQCVPNALACLKFFGKDAPQYHILCAGSELDVVLRSGVTFPAEWVEIHDMHPLSFFEFLTANSREDLVSLLKNGRYDLTPTYRQDYLNLLRCYFFVGGMPEAVSAFLQGGDFVAARAAQQHILSVYGQDFSKYAPIEIQPRIHMLWDSLPHQLDRDNRKFVFGAMREGARAREFEPALAWLTGSGLARDIHRISVPESPLESSEDPRAFKLFLPDVGLLGCLLGLRQDSLLDGAGFFKSYHGALVEQYVLQQMDALNHLSIGYWMAERGTAAVEFLVDNCISATPVEIAIEQNLQSKKLKVFQERFQPKMSIRLSLSDYRREPGLLNLPLWAVETM